MVKLNSKKYQVQPMLDGTFKVWVKAKPKNGLANKEILEVLANYFEVAKSQIAIKRGLTSRKKLIVIES